VFVRSQIRTCWYCACTIVALFAGTLCAQTAAASCGDWLANHAAENDSPSKSTARPLAASLAGFDDDNDQQRRMPCRGLACGKAPRDPFDIPPPHVRSYEQQQFAALTSSLLPHSSAARLAPASDEPQPPSATPSPPEHPPRAME
jgi:hypothetical protein